MRITIEDTQGQQAQGQPSVSLGDASPAAGATMQSSTQDLGGIDAGPAPTQAPHTSPLTSNLSEGEAPSGQPAVAHFGGLSGGAAPTNV